MQEQKQKGGEKKFFEDFSDEKNFENNFNLQLNHAM